MGGLQDIPQAAVVAPLCRRVETVSERTHVLPRLDAVWEAAVGASGFWGGGGGDGPAGPAAIEFPTDLLRETLAGAELDRSWMAPRPPERMRPDPAAVAAAATVLRSARRLVVISGRGALRAGPTVERFLASTGGLYLDTAESRGALHAGQGACVPAVRGRVMREADTGHALEALLAAGCAPSVPDRRWREEVVTDNAERARRLAERLRAEETGSDGLMHPYRLIAALNDVITDDSVVVADGGDILSFARVALRAPTWLDPGPLGCLGVGTPFAVAAALAGGGRPVFGVPDRQALTAWDDAEARRLTPPNRL